jgi:hypothetical protein
MAVFALATVSTAALIVHSDGIYSAVSQSAILSPDGPVFDTGSSGASNDKEDDSAGLSVDTTADASIEDTPVPTPSSEPPAVVHLRKTSNPNVASPVLDEYVAQQYPGYRVAKRISFPDQWGSGRLGVNYLLRSKRHPQFELLVRVMALKKGEDPYDTNVTQYVLSGDGRVLTDEHLFSTDALQQNGTLRDGMQDRLVAAFAEKMPASSFVYNASIDGVEVGTEIAQGSKGLDFAIQDNGDALTSGTASALIPVVAGRDSFDVEIDFAN